MSGKIMVVLSILLTMGCSTTINNEVKKKSNKPSSKGTIEKIQINGSPNPPKGVTRPLAKKKQNKRIKE